jgi:membrane protease YdiL (CAAX protease family)
MPDKSHQSDGFPMAVIVEGAIALAAVILAWLFGVPLREMIPEHGMALVAAIARGLMATVPMLVAFWWLVHSDRPALRELREQVDRLIGEMFPAAGVGQLAFVAVLAGVGEELLFRGVLQTIFGWWTTPTVGLVLASLLFGLAHALSKVYFLLAAVIGFYLGGLMWYFDDLIAPIVAHGVYDFVALTYLSRSRTVKSLNE